MTKSKSLKIGTGTDANYVDALGGILENLQFVDFVLGILFTKEKFRELKNHHGKKLPI